MASPSTVITLGYGSYGSAALVPTLGYGIGAAAIDYGVGYAENVVAYIPGAEMVEAFKPGSEYTVAYIPGGEAVRSV